MSARSWTLFRKIIACVLLAVFSVLPSVRAAEPDAIPIVDCHVHLWDIGRTEGVTWIAKDDKVLHRSFLPEHHAPTAKANGVRAIVVVQAGQSLPDNQWNLDITAHDKTLYRGIVVSVMRSAVRISLTTYVDRRWES